MAVFCSALWSGSPCTRRTLSLCDPNVKCDGLDALVRCLPLCRAIPGSEPWRRSDCPVTPDRSPLIVLRGGAAPAPPLVSPAASRGVGRSGTLPACRRRCHISTVASPFGFIPMSRSNASMTVWVPGPCTGSRKRRGLSIFCSSAPPRPTNLLRSSCTCSCVPISPGARRTSGYPSTRFRSAIGRQFPVCLCLEGSLHGPWRGSAFVGILSVW